MRGVATVAALAALTLAACAPTHRPADPCAAANRDVDLFGLIGNMASSVYEECLADLRGKLARARLQATNFQAEAKRLEAEAAALEGESAAAAQRLADANARQAAALRELKAAQASEAVDQARLQGVLARSAALAEQLEELNRAGGVDAERAERLQREQADLIRRIGAMLGESSSRDSSHISSIGSLNPHILRNFSIDGML